MMFDFSRFLWFAYFPHPYVSGEVNVFIIFCLLPQRCDEGRWKEMGMAKASRSLGHDHFLLGVAPTTYGISQSWLGFFLL